MPEDQDIGAREQEVIRQENQNAADAAALVADRASFLQERDAELVALDKEGDEELREHNQVNKDHQLEDDKIQAEVTEASHVLSEGFLSMGHAASSLGEHLIAEHVPPVVPMHISPAGVEFFVAVAEAASPLVMPDEVMHVAVEGPHMEGHADHAPESHSHGAK